MSSRRVFLVPVLLAALLPGCGGDSGSAVARGDTVRAVAAATAAPASASASLDVVPSDPMPSAAANAATSRAAEAPPHVDGSTTQAGRSATNTAALPRRIVLGDIDLTSVGYDVGDPNAPVVLIDFSDFGCPYCAKFTTETYPAIEREYVRTGKVLFKYVPFVMGMFPNGQEAARAAECAAEQGRFWPMHDRLYARQAEWKRAGDPAVPIGSYVDSLGLDRARFGACYARGEHARTRRANDIARAIGVRVTPSFIVDERPIEGALPLADFRRVIDAALLLHARK